MSAPAASASRAPGKQRDFFHIDDQRDIARARDVRCVAEQSEAGDVGGAVEIHRNGGATRRGVERRHRFYERGLFVPAERAAFRSGRENASADRFREHERIAGFRGGVREDALRVNRARHGQAVFQFLIGDRVTADDVGAALVHGVLTAP